MTTELQEAALAELDGLNGPTVTYYDGSHGGGYYMGFKPYLTSYDAIIPLIQSRWEGSSWSEWQGRFYQPLQNCPTILKATPSQLCEALLRASGKWKE